MTMKKQVILVLVVAAVAIAPTLLWEYTGASAGTEFRQDIIDGGGVECKGTSWVSQDQLSELERFLETYPVGYQLEILDVDGSMVQIEYYFLSAEDFDYLESEPISFATSFSNAAVPALMVLVGVAIAIGMVGGVWGKRKEQTEEVEA